MTKEHLLTKLQEQIAEGNTIKKALASLQQEHRRLEAIRAENLRRLDTFLEESVVVLDFIQKEVVKDNPSHFISALFESLEMLIHETIRGFGG